MDVAFNQHSERARRKNRSATNLNHLSLAPLTAKLPLHDDDLLPESPSHNSYLQGKSAPTTPRLFSRSPTTPRSRSHNRTPSATIAKSKSASHLTSEPSAPAARKTHSGRATPSRRNNKDDSLSFSLRHRNDSDWLLRTGALMSSEARESKGQAWLVSRQSSTSLSGLRDPEDVEFENELAREREVTAASRHHSRTGSAVLSEGDTSPYASRFPSRAHSRSHSLSRPRSAFVTPLERPGHISGFDPEMADSYFPIQDLPGPDFVNLDERLEELDLDNDAVQDEVTVQRLVRRGQAGTGTWFGSVWSLFAVNEAEEETDSEDESSPTDGSNLSQSRSWSSRNLAGISNVPQERIPPPSAEDGGWKDAAWLLSVASKVMF